MVDWVSETVAHWSRMWNLQGTPRQVVLVREALAVCDFPFELMSTSLAAEGKDAVDVTWADLSRFASTGAVGGGHGHHDHDHPEGVHTVERVLDGRMRVLGLFYLPPHTKIVLDLSLETHPTLAKEVFLAEAAHAVDYHHMVHKNMRLAVWNILHGTAADTPIPESGDVDHGHSWFDGPGGYNTWVGEAFMEAFIRAYAPSIPVTIQLDHPVTADMAGQIRAALTPTGDQRVYQGKSTTYHDSHKRITPVKWYESSAVAEAAGLRPCLTCKPT